METVEPDRHKQELGQEHAKSLRKQWMPKINAQLHHAE